MKATLSRLNLTALLTKIQNITPAKPVAPILGSLLLEAQNDELIISATDGTVSMRIYTEAKVAEEGAIALPARQFIQLIRELTAPIVEIHTSPADLCHINSGASHFKLKGMLKQEFPEMPDLGEASGFSINAKELKETLARSTFSAARSDTQNLLNAIYLESTPNSTFVMTTDGKRLSKIPFSAALGLQAEHSCLIPLKAAEEVIHILDTKEEDPITVKMQADKIGFEMKAITLVTKLFSGQYPDVGRIIPKAAQEALQLHREELISLLRQVCLFTSEHHPSVRFSFNPGELAISINAPNVGEGVVRMPVNYAGQALNIAFNPVYFLDVLKHIKDETVLLSLTDSYNPGLITDSTSAQFVIMPMRLENV
ncbi:MAG: polymerase subunit beta [Chlamydiota bacterium]|jgi:DNA polymerase-3 subunit beta